MQSYNENPRTVPTQSQYQFGIRCLSSHSTGVDEGKFLVCRNQDATQGSRLAKGSFKTDRFQREVDFLWSIFTCVDLVIVHHTPLVVRMVSNVTPRKFAGEERFPFPFFAFCSFFFSFL